MFFGKVKENDEDYFKHFSGMILLLAESFDNSSTHYQIISWSHNQDKRMADATFQAFKEQGCCETLEEHRINWFGIEHLEYQVAPGNPHIPINLIKNLTNLHNSEAFQNAPELGYLF